jgi:hypothetical protein
MVTRRSAQPSGETLAKEIKRRPRFMQGRWLGNAVEKYSISFTVLKGELKITLAGLRQSASAAELIEKFLPCFQAQAAENVVAVAEAFIYGGSGCAGGFSHGTHGERFLAAPGPQA